MIKGDEMKKMLMIYPNNFLQGAMGTNNRVMQLVHIFREIGFEIDYFGFENFSPNSSFRDFRQQNKERKLIHKLFLYDFQKGYGRNQLVERVCNKVNKFQEKECLQDWVPPGAQRMFVDLLRHRHYDVIITFYTYLASFFKNKKIHAKKVYFMEDSMFLQQYAWDKDRIKEISLGKLMDEEIARIQYFDEVFCISNDERIFYEKITEKKMYFLPHLMPDNIVPIHTPLSDRKWDVFFIGFNNTFNVEGLEWFLEKVYPLLKKDLKILFVGSATNDIKIKYENVDILPFVPDLDEIYANIKVVICPMFQGTGMKVKVVEAMSSGLPVVCNERGVDGMPDKTMCGCLVTQSAAEFAGYINQLTEDEAFYTQKSQEIMKYYHQTFDRKKYLKLLQKTLA